MKSHILSLSLLFLACLGMSACSEQDWANEEQSQCLELAISCTEVGISRADESDTRPGETTYKENLIETLHYFLYPKGKTNQNAVISDKMGIANGTNGEVVIRVPLSETELNNVLFPRPVNDCEVYLIANLPDEVLNGVTDTSLDALKSLVVSTNFNSYIINATTNTQPPFIMDGQCTATITSRNKTIAAKGTLTLDRLAAKITTRISVNPSYTDTDGKVYEPQVKNMQIRLDNAGGNTTLSGGFATEPFLDFAKRERVGTKTETVDGTTTTYSVFAPFYSYPRKWEYNDNALVMYIELPWVYQQGGVTQTVPCYYKVYPSIMQLDRNNWYNLDLNIGVLGSFSDTAEEPLEIKDFKYQVVDWKNGYNEWDAGVNLETEILSAYYLVVEQNKYVVNNKNTYEIPFVSSHECEIHNLKVTKKIFIKDNQPVNENKDVTQDATAGNWITVEGNTIKLNHTLNNDFVNTDTYDYSPYTFTFILRHKNNPDKYKEEITIIQKPALSITAHLNSYDKPGEKFCGYVFVNGNAPRSTVNGNLPEYGNVQGRNESGNNSNPYMYTIEVSVLPNGSNFILGDPRVKYNFGTDIDAQTNFYSATSVNGGSNRRLTNYYGTSKDVLTENMIAPKFRICSAHGWCSGGLVSYKDAFNRAASYQEDGYPAGRWRVPTKAEILFVHKLYTDNFIPSLFYGSYAYWSATGKVNGNNVTNDTSGSSPLRCVYDEWYWENSTVNRLSEGAYNTFTWGDEIE